MFFILPLRQKIGKLKGKTVALNIYFHLSNELNLLKDGVVWFAFFPSIPQISTAKIVDNTLITVELN